MLWPNTFLGPLSYTFVLNRFFKFLRFQIGPLSFEFVLDMSFFFIKISDKSFKFLRFQIGPLSFEFISDRSFLFNYFSITERTYLKQTRNLKDISETLET